MIHPDFTQVIKIHGTMERFQNRFRHLVGQEIAQLARTKSPDLMWPIWEGRKQWGMGRLQQNIRKLKKKLVNSCELMKMLVQIM